MVTKNIFDNLSKNGNETVKIRSELETAIYFKCLKCRKFKTDIKFFEIFLRGKFLNIVAGSMNVVISVYHDFDARVHHQIIFRGHV